MKVNLERRSEIGEARRRRTLEKILKAMLDVLSERRFDDCTVDDFIQAAGMSRGTFYNYFKNKDDIAHTVATLLNSIIEATIVQVAPSQERAVDRIALALATFLDFAAQAPHLAEVMFREFLRHYPRYPTFVESSSERFRHEYEKGAAEGDLTISAPDVLQDAVSGTLAFLMVRMVYSPGDQHKTIMRQGINYILLGQGVSKAKAKSATDKAIKCLPLADLSVVESSFEEVIDLVMREDD